jgi:hypothetical protein
LLNACVVKETASLLAPRVKRYATAASACARELRSLGAAAFASRYGTNSTGSDAFGKCVSKKVRG